MDGGLIKRTLFNVPSVLIIAFSTTLPWTFVCKAKVGYSGIVPTTGNSPEDRCDTRPAFASLVCAEGAVVFAGCVGRDLSAWITTFVPVRGRYRRPFCASITSN